MKRYFLFLLGLWALQACYREEALTPTQLESATSKFDFPQGAAPADSAIAEIYGRYGVKLIYKAFTQSDVDRAWKSPEGASFVSTRCEWSYLDEKTQLKAAIDVLKESVFGLLPDAVVKAGLRACPYLYVVENIRYAAVGSSGEQMSVYPTKGLDSWMVSVALGYRQPDSYSMRVVYPAQIMCEIFVHAYAEGAMTMPPEFFAGLDARGATLKSYNAAVAAGPGTPDYENYWARRGFPPFVSSIGRIFTGPSQSSCAVTANIMPPLTEDTREIAQFFLFLCLDNHWEEYFEPDNIFDDCPKLKDRLYLFHSRMEEEYGVDFEAIRSKLYEGATMDKSPTRYANKENAGDFTFIYGDY
ncbi:MAG: hypothetical protein LBG47_10195 [Prevotellaceae bacterium]|jgi:hypothetical protein|nr:hypothetical protein [Prevotellaceae bacterium]